MHLLAAGREHEAASLALPAARQLRDRVALHAAAERYRWSLARTPDDAVSLELAQVLGRAGDGAAAGELLEALAQRAPTPVGRRELQRLAAEQYLRAGAAERGAGRCWAPACRRWGCGIPREPARPHVGCRSATASSSRWLRCGGTSPCGTPGWSRRASTLRGRPGWGSTWWT